jgi:hypothetical protein
MEQDKFRDIPGPDATDLEEIEKCVNNPLYYYNKYVRLPGHVELTQEQYDQKVKQYKKEVARTKGAKNLLNKVERLKIEKTLAKGHVLDAAHDSVKRELKEQAEAKLSWSQKLKGKLKKKKE